MDMEEWTCRNCTLINSGDMLNCNACYTFKPRREPGLPNLTNPEPAGPCHTRPKKEGSSGWSIDLCSHNERRIVFFGRTGSGKSATANNILGGKIFKSGACGSSVTKWCQRGRASRFNRDIQIIDIPGLFDTGMTNAEITKEVMKCVNMTAPGPHAFVLLVRIGRFTPGEQDTVDHFRQVFGDDMLNYLIILFTKKDDLRDENITLQEYLREVPKELQGLLVSCNNRCVAFNNRGSDAEKEQDVRDFITLVDRVFLDNGGKCYTSEMFVEAEKKMKMREEQLRQKYEQKIQEERNAIRRKFELKLQMKDDEDTDLKKQLEERRKTLEKEKVEETGKKAESELEAEKQDFRDFSMVMRKQLEGTIKTLDEKIKTLDRKKVDDAEKTVGSEIAALSKQIEDLEIALKRIKEVQETLEAKKTDFREESRKEVNEEKPGVIGMLEWVLPSIMGLVVPTIVKRIFKTSRIMQTSLRANELNLNM